MTSDSGSQSQSQSFTDGINGEHEAKRANEEYGGGQRSWS